MGDYGELSNVEQSPRKEKWRGYPQTSLQKGNLEGDEVDVEKGDATMLKSIVRGMSNSFFYLLFPR